MICCWVYEGGIFYETVCLLGIFVCGVNKFVDLFVKFGGCSFRLRRPWVDVIFIGNLLSKFLFSRCWANYCFN